MNRSYFIKTMREDAIAGSTVGSGAIAGAGVGPQGAAFMGPRAAAKYKAGNKRGDEKLDMDRALWGKLAPPKEGDAEDKSSGNYNGGKNISHGGEFDYMTATAKEAPQSPDEHARKLTRRLLGKE